MSTNAEGSSRARRPTTVTSSSTTPAGGRVRRPLDVSGLCDVGGVSVRSLHVRPVPLAVLLAGDSRVVTSQLVRPEARGVAGVAAVLAGPLHPADPGVLPAHVLLLPRRLLQGVLGGSAVVHRRRAAIELLGREL